MVTLTKIKKNDNVVTFEYFPEGNKEDVGFVSYDLTKKEVFDFKYCIQDEKSNLKGYFKKSVRAIKELVKQEELPKEYVYMWY